MEINFYSPFRMKKIFPPPMPRESGVPTSNRAFKKHSPSIHHAADEKSFSPKRGRCMVSSNKPLLVSRLTPWIRFSGFATKSTAIKLVQPNKHQSARDLSTRSCFLLNQNRTRPPNALFPHQSEWVKLIKLLHVSLLIMV